MIVAWDGGPAEFELALPTQNDAEKISCTVEPEDQDSAMSQRLDLDPGKRKPSLCGRFVTMQMRLPAGLEHGYHRLTIECSGKRFRSLIISAPRRAYAADSTPGGDWGCFLPLYALRSERNWGAGDFTDLHNLTDWIADLGGSVVGTLPMLAAFLDEPCEVSPYAPASRLAWNEFYVDIHRIPELDGCREAAELLQSAALLEDVARLRAAKHVEYARLMALKRQVLQKLANAFFDQKPPRRYAEFEQFLQAHPHVEDYAAFRAAHERARKPWNEWLPAARAGRLSHDDYDLRGQRYHLYAQWIATTQLETLADAAGGGLYLDLPLGVHPDGYDAWRWNEVYACGASAGSPPDAVWTKGQDWAFPPLHPERIREDGYRHVRDYLGHHLRISRLLRIDHVMQLHRLFWIPHGLPASQGVYVQYRPKEFYAILALESHRYRTTLIGENLGTVPPQVNRAMRGHNLQQMYVVQYEIASEDEEDDGAGPAEGTTPATRRESATGDGVPPDKGDRPAAMPGACRPPVALRDVPPGCMASLNTHDMPTFAAWWRGEDLAVRQELGLIDGGEAQRLAEELQSTKAELSAWLRSRGWLGDAEQDDAQVLLAILKFLSASPAGVVLVNLEDLWLETRPQNVPGTGPERPNWQRKATPAFDEFTRRTDVLAALQSVSRLRQQAKTNPQEQPSKRATKTS